MGGTAKTFQGSDCVSSCLCINFGNEGNEGRKMFDVFFSRPQMEIRKGEM